VASGVICLNTSARVITPAYKYAAVTVRFITRHVRAVKAGPKINKTNVSQGRMFPRPKFKPASSEQDSLKCGNGLDYRELLLT
jgi:hypothetical protein